MLRPLTVASQLTAQVLYVKLFYFSCVFHFNYSGLYFKGLILNLNEHGNHSAQNFFICLFKPYYEIAVNIFFPLFSAYFDYKDDAAFPKPPSYNVATSLPSYDEAERTKAEATVPLVSGRVSIANLSH